MEIINVGDLVILKGFNHKIDLAPIGVVVEMPTSKHFRINWVNKQLAAQWAVTTVVSRDKVEKLT